MRSFLAILALLMAALVPARAAAQPAPPAPLVSCPPPGSLPGVDVSQWTGGINWPQVALSQSFAYARAADGLTPDVSFAENYAGIKAAGMHAGAYLFFRPDLDPALQAQAFVDQFSGSFAPGDMIPMIDVEDAGGQISTTIASRLQVASGVIRSTLHVNPGIYTSRFFWDGNVGSTDFAGAPLWIGQWSVGCPVLPAAWQTWALWQHSGSGTVPGITVPVDLNWSSGPSLPVFRTIYLPMVNKTPG